jgi:hypothetical protein
LKVRSIGADCNGFALAIEGRCSTQFEHSRCHAIRGEASRVYQCRRRGAGRLGKQSGGHMGPVRSWRQRRSVASHGLWTWARRSARARAPAFGSRVGREPT